MRKKSIVAMMAIAAMVTTMAVPAGAAEAEKDYKIGFAQCTLASPFYVSMKDAAEEYAKELGVELVVVSADDDVTKQNNDINDMITGGIDALIVNPINAEGIAPAIEACTKAEIPVITVDRNINEGYTAYVGRDNEAMGKLVGEALVEQNIWVERIRQKEKFWKFRAQLEIQS